MSSGALSLQYEGYLRKAGHLHPKTPIARGNIFVAFRAMAVL